MDILSFFKNLFTSKKEVECCDQPTKVSEPSEVKSEEMCCSPEIKFNTDLSTGVDKSKESPVIQKEEVVEAKDEVKSPKKKRYYKPKKKKITPKKG